MCRSFLVIFLILLVRLQRYRFYSNVRRLRTHYLYLYHSFPFPLLRYRGYPVFFYSAPESYVFLIQRYSQTLTSTEAHINVVGTITEFVNHAAFNFPFASQTKQKPGKPWVWEVESINMDPALTTRSLFRYLLNNLFSVQIWRSRYQSNKPVSWKASWLD